MRPTDLFGSERKLLTNLQSLSFKTSNKNYLLISIRIAPVQAINYRDQ